MKDLDAILQPDEKVITRATLNMGVVLVPLALLVIGAAIFFLNLGEALDQVRIPALLLLIIGGWGTAVSLSRRFTTQLVLTDQRILGQHGLLRPQTVDSPLNKIDQIQVERPLLGRVLGFGTLVVTLSGAGRGREQFSQISAPEQVAQQIRDEAITRRNTPR